jgi:cytochrome c biogenesis protein
MAGSTLTTGPQLDRDPDDRPPAMRPVEFARWTWRQLTSMRTALVLLFLLTLAAVPGSIVPQTGANPVRVEQFRAAHKVLGPWYDRLSLFNVYAAPWFAAIYLLLFVSLAGCVVPRSRAHLATLRSRPPVAPRHLDRMPESQRWTTDADAASVGAAAARALRGRRYRVEVRGDAISAEKGYLRETGNLVFHVALVLLLLGVGVGKLYGYKGSVLVVEGSGFANTVTSYDNFSSGAAFQDRDLTPFSLRLHRLDVRYQASGDQRGAPRDFEAHLTYRPEPDARPRSYDLRVNHPLGIGGDKVFLLANGYAPVFTVRDSTGHVVFDGPVPFLPDRPQGGGEGVVKVPGAQPDQLGFSGLFMPTAALDLRLGPVSTYPDTRRPRVFLNAWYGDLGTDSGVPQSVYKLVTTHMTQIRNADGTPLAKALAPHQQMSLPDGRGSIRFDGVRRFATLQVSHDPGKPWALGAAALALVGLLLSLFVRRRRIWVRIGTRAGGRTLVEVAGLSRTEGGGLADELAEIRAGLWLGEVEDEGGSGPGAGPADEED